MVFAGCDGGEGPFRRVGLPVVVVAPAGGGAVAAERARVAAAGCDGGEGPLGWAVRTGAVVAPAGGGGVGAERAHVGSAGCDGGVGPLGRGGLPAMFCAPEPV